MSEKRTTYYKVIETPCFPCKYQAVQFANGREYPDNSTHYFFRTIAETITGIESWGGVYLE